MGGAEGFGGGEVREERGRNRDSDVEGGEVMGWWGLDTGAPVGDKIHGRSNSFRQHM